MTPKLSTKTILNKYPRQSRRYNKFGINRAPNWIFKFEGIHLLEKALNIDPNQTQALSNLGNGLVDIGDYKEAIKLFNKSISLDIKNVDAFYNRGRTHKLLELYDEALMDFNQAIILNPTFILPYISRSSILMLKKDYLNAEKDLNLAISINPEFVEAFNNRGLFYKELKLFDNALRDFNRAIELDPAYAEGFVNRGALFNDLKDYDKALEDYGRAIDIKPGMIEVHSARALIFIKTQVFHKAIEDLNLVISYDPQHSESYINLGIALNAIGKLDDALECYDRAILINPKVAEAYTSRASLLSGLNKKDEALEDYKKAISINPEFVEAFNNRGLFYKELKLFDNALRDFNRAIELDPAYAEGFVNRGALFNDLKDYDKALEDYGRAINLNSKLSEAYLNSSIIYLSKKRFAIGWDYYEKRSEVQKTKSDFLDNNTQPELISPNLKGKTILIFSEQGLGDQILYLTMLSELNSKDNQIIVMLNERLIELYKRSFVNIQFIPKSYSLKKLHYDYYILSGSLGKLFRPNIQSFKNQVSGYLKPDKDKTKQLKTMLHEKDKKICGISWKSQNQEIGLKKSIDLADFYNILNIKNVKFIDLQYGDTTAEIRKLKELYNIDIHKVSEIDNYSDLDGLSSLIDACDFVVTTSNVTAHIAGAIGKETFLIVPYSQGKMWYWHEGDVKNLWYPNVTQYSIHKDQDVKITINEIAVDIKRTYL
jgi:tetratricopeptide (TPR) repeat protein